MANWVTLQVGMVFDTPFETGCVVTEIIADEEYFMANDSDGQECIFFPETVTHIHIDD